MALKKREFTPETGTVDTYGNSLGRFKKIMKQTARISCIVRLERQRVVIAVKV